MASRMKKFGQVSETIICLIKFNAQKYLAAFRTATQGTELEREHSDMIMAEGEQYLITIITLLEIVSLTDNQEFNRQDFRERIKKTLGLKIIRDGLNEVLAGMVTAGELQAAEADEIFAFFYKIKKNRLN